jgi:DNA-directed RNA polymerase specialized sigma24 family protein
MGTGSAPVKKKDWELTQAAFDRLLERLDTDRDEAGKRYEELRRKLVGLLRFWGSRYPEEGADEAITRTARKIVEGETIENLNAYVIQIARFTYLEQVKKEAGERAAVPVSPLEQPHAVDPVQEKQRAACYQECLNRLSTPDRELIFAYYQGSAVPDRENLAMQRGMLLSSLRVITFRIRKRLKDCQQNCFEDSLTR